MLISFIVSHPQSDFHDDLEVDGDIYYNNTDILPNDSMQLD